VPKREVAVKLPSHRLGSAGTLAPYGMTVGGEGSNEADEWPLDAGSDVASLMTRGGCDGGREKLNDWALLLDGVRESSVDISMLFSEATLTA